MILPWQKNNLLPRCATALFLIAAAFLMVACTASDRQTDTAPTSEPTIGKEATEAMESTFTNPVLDKDFPDPDLLLVDGVYYAYATNSGATNIQVARSTDLVQWEVLPDALPQLPEWALQDFGYAWAPEVFQRAEDPRYVMYFVARAPIGAGGVQCIAVATSATPEGPFESTAPEPFICQSDDGGSIDAATFKDEDGQLYVLWKNDGNSRGSRTWIYIQKVSADGMTLEGEPTQLIVADQPWEGILVEAPTLWKKDGKYYLFYSANAYNDQRYAVGYAVASDIFGPYEKAAGPFLKTNVGAGIVGPGGQDIVIGPRGGEWMLYHGWASGGYRRLYLAPLTWENGAPQATPNGKNPLPMP